MQHTLPSPPPIPGQGAHSAGLGRWGVGNFFLNAKRKELHGERKELFPAGKELSGTRKELFSAGKELSGKRKELFSRGKELPGERKELFSSGKDLPGEKEEPFATEAALFRVLALRRGRMERLSFPQAARTAAGLLLSRRLDAGCRRPNPLQLSN